MKRILLGVSALLLVSAAHAQAPGSGIPPGIVTGNTNVPTYSAAATNIANAATGDVYCIQGSATKTVKVKGVRIAATATAKAVVDVTLVKRSTLDTGGTAATLTLVPHDSMNAAGTAVVKSYSVSPTPGTAVGTFRNDKLGVGTTGNDSAHDQQLFQFSVYWDQPVVLRGVNQSVCVNFPTAGVGAGASINVDHEHTEE